MRLKVGARLRCIRGRNSHAEKLLALLFALATFAAFAAVDVNKATQAGLDSIMGKSADFVIVLPSARQSSQRRLCSGFASA
jgi:outer membrane lipoprotein-sorting protein